MFRLWRCSIGIGLQIMEFSDYEEENKTWRKKSKCSDYGGATVPIIFFHLTWIIARDHHSERSPKFR